MKRKAITAAIMALAVSALQITVPVSADFYSDSVFTYEEWNNFLLGPGWYYVDDGYDVQYTKDAADDINSMIWIPYYIKSIDGYEIEPASMEGCEELKIKVPNSYKSETSEKEPKYVKSIYGSCEFKEFDLDPDSDYLKLVDNVVFSKDGKTLFSYARFDERTVYDIPDGTEIIGKAAIWGCSNIVEITMPDSVRELQRGAFRGMEALERVNIPPLTEELPQGLFCYDKNLKEVNIPENSKLEKINEAAFGYSKISSLMLPSFEIEIERSAFVECENNISLKSYVKPDVKAAYVNSKGKYQLKWNKIPNASKYEVYQKLSDGSYKLIKTVKGTSINLNGMKSRKKYTFAVKPIAKIKAFGDGGQFGDFNLPEYYTIEGTMSDNVTFTAE